MTHPSNALLELADRVEQATGPDRDLDGEIHSGIGKRDQQWSYAPSYTASLDAAMTLVPEGLDVNLWWGIRKGLPLATAEIDAGMVGMAATPALALAAACLRTRGQQ